jgi:hypothetical protein
MEEQMSDYEVGFKKPPKAHQIKKGERRNPNGRPRKLKPVVDNSEAAILKRMDEELIEVGGIEMTMREAELRALRARAIKGDARATAALDKKRAAAKLDQTQASGGGVLLVPVVGSLAEWEAAAACQQAPFRESDPGALEKLYDTQRVGDDDEQEE